MYFFHINRVTCVWRSRNTGKATFKMALHHVCLLGAQESGKTTLGRKWAGLPPDSHYYPTTEDGFTIPHHDMRVSDTAGCNSTERGAAEITWRHVLIANYFVLVVYPDATHHLDAMLALVSKARCGTHDPCCLVACHGFSPWMPPPVFASLVICVVNIDAATGPDVCLAALKACWTNYPKPVEPAPPPSTKRAPMLRSLSAKFSGSLISLKTSGTRSCSIEPHHKPSPLPFKPATLSPRRHSATSNLLETSK